jgi:hypothetical protein
MNAQDVHGRLFLKGRSWTLKDAHRRSSALIDDRGRFSDADRTLGGRKPDAGRTFGKFGHATVTVTLQKHKKY